MFNPRAGRNMESIYWLVALQFFSYGLSKE